MAHDLFLHHFGSRTFAGNGIDAEALLEENARRFAAKWGQGTPRGRRVALQPWSPLPEGPQMMRSGHGDENRPQIPQIGSDENAGLQIPDSQTSGAASPSDLRQSAQSADPSLPSSGDRLGPRARVSLTMIVRNEQDNLLQCLASVRDVFDEIIVVDTGSTDRTREIAAEFGARVFDFAWIDDFAAARNEALSHATGDHIFWLDADDVVDPPEREKLKALLDGLERPGEGEPPDEPSGHRARTEPRPPGGSRKRCQEPIPNPTRAGKGVRNRFRTRQERFLTPFPP